MNEIRKFRLILKSIGIFLTVCIIRVIPIALENEKKLISSRQFIEKIIYLKK